MGSADRAPGCDVLAECCVATLAHRASVSEGEPSPLAAPGEVALVRYPLALHGYPDFAQLLHIFQAEA